MPLLAIRATVPMVVMAHAGSRLACVSFGDANRAARQLLICRWLISMQRIRILFHMGQKIDFIFIGLIYARFSAAAAAPPARPRWRCGIVHSSDDRGTGWMAAASSADGGRLPVRRWPRHFMWELLLAYLLSLPMRSAGAGWPFLAGVLALSPPM